MKESKSVLLKKPVNSTVINETMDDKKEIELLKQKLKKSQKKYNDEKKLRESLTNYNHGLLKKSWYLEERVKKELANTKFWQELCFGIQSVVEISTKKYCDLILESNNLNPCQNVDIKYHKTELEKMINMLSLLINKNDLLENHGINEFLSNRN